MLVETFSSWYLVPYLVLLHWLLHKGLANSIPFKTSENGRSVASLQLTTSALHVSISSFLNCHAAGCGCCCTMNCHWKTQKAFKTAWVQWKHITLNQFPSTHSISILELPASLTHSIEINRNCVLCVKISLRNVTSKCQDFQESQLALARYEKMVMDVGRTYGKKRKRPSSKCTWQTLAEALAFEVQAWGSTTSGYRKKGCRELQIIPKQV